MKSTAADSEPDRLILLGDPDGERQPTRGPLHSGAGLQVTESEHEERRILRPLLIEP
ncbi:MAG: hypothetical protein GY719_15535 [bacterium]|nr:hypothetical protein [bacterium]